MAMPARVTSLEDLAEWISSVAGQGADRFELWVKVRGSEQERVHVASAREPFDAADELLVRVERDRRVDVGQAAYAVFAYRGKDKAPMERAFVSPAAQAMAIPMGATPMGNGGGGAVEASPSLALMSVLSTMHQMTQEVFGSLQRENEHQRRTNETMVHAATGHVDQLAKSYERTFVDLQARYAAALNDASELRVQNDALTQRNKDLTAEYDGLALTKVREHADEARKTKRQEFLTDQLKLIVPVFMAKVAGQTLSGGGGAGGAAIGALLDSLQPEQVQGIFALLTNAQQMVLGELLHAHMNSKQAAAGPAPAAPSNGAGNVTPATSGEATSAGTAAPAPSSPEAPWKPREAGAVTTEEEKDFQRLTELLTKHADSGRYSAWLEEQMEEDGPLPDATSPANDGGDKNDGGPSKN